MTGCKFSNLDAIDLDLASCLKLGGALDEGNSLMPGVWCAGDKFEMQLVEHTDV